MGLKADILAADDLPRVAVEVPEWNTTVWVREMTGSERDRQPLGRQKNRSTYARHRSIGDLGYNRSSKTVFRRL